MRYVITVGDETFEIDVGREGRVWVDRQPYNVDLQSIDGQPQYSLLVDHRSYEAHVEEIEEGEYQLIGAGRPYRARFQRLGQRCLQNFGQQFGIYCFCRRILQSIDRLQEGLVALLGLG